MSLPEDLKKEFPELEQPESLWETLERDLPTAKTLWLTGILSFWRCLKFGEFRLMREGCAWLSQLKTDI